MTTNTNAALVEYANPLNWDVDENGIRRVWKEPGSETPEAYNGFELAKAALSTAAQTPADGALNTIAAMFHSGEEIEGPDGLAMMVDMSVWNDALDAFDEISGDEMEPAHPTAGIWVPTELAERVQETMGEFLMDHGWRQQDMDTSDEFGALLAVATKAEPLQQPEKVPLTKTQLKQIHHIEEFGLFCDYSEFEQIARAIEQFHGIKPAKEQA